MPTIRVEGLSSYKVPEPLNNGWYDAVVSNANPVNDERFAVNFMVTDGQTQADESDPQGRKFSAFFTIAGYENHKDRGEFAKRMLVEFLQAVGIDYENDEFELDDLVDREVVVYVKSKPNQDGIITENAVMFKPKE